MVRVRDHDTYGIMGRAMDAAMLRQNILADNLTNVSTPGFKRSDVSFQTHLQRALEQPNRIELARSSSRHFTTQPSRDPMQIQPRVFVESTDWARNDLNNVNIDAEMSHLAQNTLYFQGLASRLAAKYRILSTVVTRTQAM